MENLRILRGREALTLEQQQRETVAKEISAQLSKHPERMRQIHPRDIRGSMEEGRFILLLGQQEQLVACTQVWPLPGNPTIMECGTWLNVQPPGYPQGMGSRAMQEGARLARTFPETQQTLALVEEGNIKAQMVLKKLGGEHIDTRPSDFVTIAPDQPAQMHVFDITHI